MIAVASVALVAQAQPAAPAERKVVPPPPQIADAKVPFERYSLDNGLEVILIPDSTVPLVAIDVWYHVGSGHEVVGRSGFAHLFEHMLFQGSKNVGSDRHFEVLKQIGADGVNGTTNTDRTNYFEVVPSNQLEVGLWLESDRMGFLLPLLTETSLQNQIEVVRNERRQRIDNVPYGKARLALYDALYPDGHPYKFTTIGRHEDLEAATLADVRRFYQTWYVPANATLALAGDFEVAAVKPLIEKWFGKFPRSQKPAVVTIPTPTIAARRLELTDPFARLRQVTWAWHSPANFGAGDAELDLVADALGADGTGRLYKILVHQRQLAQNVSVSQNGSTFSGVFSVTVTLRSDADLAEVERIVGDEVARVTREPLDRREIARSIATAEASRIYGLEGLIQRAELLHRYNHYLGDPDRISWDLDRYRTTTPEAITAAARQWLTDRRIEMVVMPAAAAPAAPAAGGGK